MPRLNPRSSQDGLTLIEVLIAMALLSFISIAIYQATTSSFDLNFRLGAEANDYSALSLSLQAVETDLAQIYSPIMESRALKPDEKPTTFWTPPVKPSGLRRARLLGEKEKLSFIGNGNRRVEADSPQSDFQKVIWEIERNDRGAYSLYRVTDPNVYEYEENALGAKPPSRVALLENLASAQFTYYRKANKTWEEKWDSEDAYAKAGSRFPELIKLRIEIPDPLNSASQQIWEVVVRPNLPLNMPTAEEKEKEKQQFLE